MPDQPEPEPTNPDELMAGVKSRSFPWIVIFSVGVHLLVIFGTSIGYMRLMRQYGSWHPRLEMKRLAKERREQEVESRRKADHAKFVADRAKGEAGGKEGEKGTAPGTATKGEGEKPKVLKDIEATSGERPKESSLKLNELDLP